jgi:signal transduction histidine kinase
METAAVQQQTDALMGDPLLNGTERRRTRRFKPDEPEPERPAQRSGDSGLLRFWQWVSDAGRVLVWLGFFAIAGLLVLWLPAWWRRSGLGRPLARLPEAPTHVMALDIRPHSLPEDIGTAAAALWQRGEQRAALSLLYRGMLSRLVHEHRVPIRAASTEGECLAMARPRLAAGPAAYVEALVRLWQGAVYADQWPAQAEVLALCRDFAARLPAQPPAPPTAGEPAAGLETGPAA